MPSFHSLMSRWLGRSSRSLPSRKRSRGKKQSRPASRVYLESLEPRLVLTVTPYNVTQLASFPTGPGFSNVNGLAMDAQGDLFAAITTGGQTSNGGQTGDGSIVEQVAGSSTLMTLAQFNGRQWDSALRWSHSRSHGQSLRRHFSGRDGQ